MAVFGPGRLISTNCMPKKSFLDHCVSTADAHDTLVNVEVCYSLTTSDHMPLALTLNMDKVPLLANHGIASFSGRLNWDKLCREDIERYANSTERLLNSIELPREALTCLNINCTDIHHATELCVMYDDIVKALDSSSKPLCKNKSRGSNMKPGWNEYVAEHHAVAREAFLLWIEAGRPRQGELFQQKKLTNARFKYAIRFIKKNENNLRAKSLASKLENNNTTDFWKEVNVLNNHKTPLPSDIEGVSSPEKIAEVWREHYFRIFNCVKSNMCVIDQEHDGPPVNCIIRPVEINDAINALGNNKACGLDHIAAEHLKYASSRLGPILAMCFSGLVIHGILPESIMSVLLVPVLKDKAGKLNSIDNYRPIALASILSKVLESILLTRLEMYVLTNDNQFGFKRKHGTDLCIYALKELVSRYNRQSTSVFLCFIDASKAFDRVNHEKLFMKLLNRGVPKYIVRILSYWYTHQTFQVKWDSAISAPFHVTNGVRQGGILSPTLFNVYMDDLSNKLNDTNTGCHVGELVVNHLMYADDLVLISPYSAGLQQLLRVCSQYGIEHDIKYNAKKSNVMIVRGREDKKLTFPSFSLSGSPLELCHEIKYLGHIITDDWMDDRDIHRQLCKLYAQANMLIRKFSMCTVDVKCSLFRTYVTPLYTAQLWTNYTKGSMRRLKVAYNDALRLLLQVPRWHNASELFVTNGLPTLEALLRNLMHGFICRLDQSKNSVMEALSSPVISCYRYTSGLRQHWRDSLYTYKMQ